MKILLFRKYAIKNNIGLAVKYFTILLGPKKKYVLKLNNNKNHNQRYCCEVYHVFRSFGVKNWTLGAKPLYVVFPLGTYS